MIVREKKCSGRRYSTKYGFVGSAVPLLDPGTKRGTKPDHVTKQARSVGWGLLGGFTPTKTH